MAFAVCTSSIPASVSLRLRGLFSLAKSDISAFGSREYNFVAAKHGAKQIVRLSYLGNLVLCCNVHVLSTVKTALAFILSPETGCACRKSNSHIQMMESAEKWRRQNATNGMYCSRRRRVLVD
jgi:hypothetical protein